MSSNIDQELIDDIEETLANKDRLKDNCIEELLENHKGLIEDYAVLLKQKTLAEFYCRKLIKNPSKNLNDEVLKYLGDKDDN